MYDTVDYGRAYWKYKFTKNPSNVELRYEMNTNFAKLENLQADTKYYFILKDEVGVSKRYWFMTAPDNLRHLHLLPEEIQKMKETLLKRRYK